ncbi:uncharacterized protein METZ01_LOCUS96189, partial [marine metagenome]
SKAELECLGQPAHILLPFPSLSPCGSRMKLPEPRGHCGRKPTLATFLPEASCWPKESQVLPCADLRPAYVRRRSLPV